VCGIAISIAVFSLGWALRPITCPEPVEPLAWQMSDVDGESAP